MMVQRVGGLHYLLHRRRPRNLPKSPASDRRRQPIYARRPLRGPGGRSLFHTFTTQRAYSRPPGAPVLTFEVLLSAGNASTAIGLLR